MLLDRGGYVTVHAYDQLARTPITEACSQARFEHGRVMSVDLLRRAVEFERADGSPTSVGYEPLIVGAGGRRASDRASRPLEERPAGRAAAFSTGECSSACD
ncbi:MAG: hypothetical protein ABIQ53_14275 [Terracoccus sp.]